MKKLALFLLLLGLALPLGPVWADAPSDCDDPAKPWRVLHKLTNKPDLALEIAGHSRPFRQRLEEMPGYPVDSTNFDKLYFLLENSGRMNLLDFHYAMALVASGAKDYETAREHLLEFTRSGVAYWPVWLMLSAMEYNLAPPGEKTGAAMKTLEEAEKELPFEPGVYRHLAWLGYSSGKDDEWVVGTLERGINAIGVEGAGPLMLDQAVFILGSMNSAKYLELLNRNTVEVLKYDKSADIVALRGAYNYLKGDYAKAMEIYSFLYTTGQNLYVGVLGAAEASHCLGDDEQAAGLIERLLEGYRGSPEEENLRSVLKRYRPEK